MKRKMDMMLDFIRANLDSRLRLSDFAQVADLSSSRVFQMFKAELGVTPHQYIKGLRLEKARDLLETTLMNIQQIRYEVGYRDDSHFVRDFKKVYGRTPTAYREQHDEWGAMGRGDESVHLANKL